MVDFITNGKLYRIYGIKFTFFRKNKNNYFTASTATSALKYVDFAKLLALAFENSEKAVKDLVNDKDFEFIVYYPDIYKKLNDYINSDKVSAKTLWNHYHLCVLLGNGQMLSDIKLDSTFSSLSQIEENLSIEILKKPKKEDKEMPPFPIPDPKLPESMHISMVENEKRMKCIKDVQMDRTFRQLIDRLYLDTVYPDKKDRKEKQRFVAKMANNIINGFQVILLILHLGTYRKSCIRD